MVWGICGLGALLRFFRGSWVRAISTFAYIALGLVAFIALKPLIASVPAGALWLLLAGVVSYACGTIFHVWQRLHYHQVVRHAFVLGGSACHLIAVLLFVLPARV